MKKIICNGTAISLKDSEFMASGGQGDIYRRAGTIYKIYHSAMPSDLVGKIQELSVLDKDNIVRPLDVLLDVNSNPIGYTMQYVDNSVGLPLLFTTSFLTRNNIELKSIQVLIKDLATTIDFIHSKGIKLVDGNEFNYLVEKKGFKKSFFIDVDSYETPSYPATAIMDSIRDFTTKKFTELTDWYSFGIVSFQLFTGIHPYKGRHDIFKTLEERCKNHVSVFNPDVRYPMAVRDFNLIPANYKDWYINLFEKGQRIPPPEMISAVAAAFKKKYVSAVLNIEKILQTDEPIIWADYVRGVLAVITKNFIYLNNKQYKRNNDNSVICCSEDGIFYEAFEDNGLTLIDITHGGSSYKDETKSGNKLFSIQGRLYSIDSGLIEFLIKTLDGKNPLVFFNHVQPIATQSTQVFENVLYADIFNRAFFYIPLGEKSIGVYQTMELSDHKVLDAKYIHNHLRVVASDRKGIYHLFYYDVSNSNIALVHKEEDITIQELNFVGLSSNVFVSYLNAEDTMTISSKDCKSQKIVKDVGIPNTSVLFTDGQKVHSIVQDTIYKLSMK